MKHILLLIPLIWQLAFFSLHAQPIKIVLNDNFELKTDEVNFVINKKDYLSINEQHLHFSEIRFAEVEDQKFKFLPKNPPEIFLIFSNAIVLTQKHMRWAPVVKETDEIWFHGNPVTNQILKKGSRLRFAQGVGAVQFYSLPDGDIQSLNWKNLRNDFPDSRAWRVMKTSSRQALIGLGMTLGGLTLLGASVRMNENSTPESTRNLTIRSGWLMFLGGLGLSVVVPLNRRKAIQLLGY